ncbi:MAG: phosphatase PAP2 family protein [Crocinitomicaceae bacterium]
MIEWLEHIDRELFLLLNSPHHPFLDAFMWYVSTTLIWIPLYLFFIVYALKRSGWKMALYVLFGAIICVALADLISVHLFKNVFMRYRPTHNLEIGEAVQTVLRPDGREYRGGTYGFVSSHAANIMAIATFVYFTFRAYSRYWWTIFIWAALILYSRIYLGVHYPSDIIAGGILGFLIAFFLYQVSKKLKPVTTVKQKT